uniref:response regulator transcription factor n=1 Tax=Serratia TaxID=613 RepID=UPI001F4C1C1A|nr:MULTISPECIES: LuxR C-terminal-related transcriptional regulator [Serratia]ULG12118.1 helix-turn-helix transcriptional regulator [Serratia entomophila]ULG12315.1 helix-turn-helix transcriptional regulator [Serratia entomophila]ULG12363.1 helix-turn-helix transcriptional regulator [Serratia entomophila]ULG15945.1 helix-turn-helix transcriptional regulator [Serratia proteamaculans]ULG18458.1 helix-turn-helix transcriptional regulator [Serratia proteamaculans]
MVKKFIVVISDTNLVFANGLALVIETYCRRHKLNVDIIYSLNSLHAAHLAFVADTLPQKIPRTQTTHSHHQYFKIREASSRERKKQMNGIIYRQQSVNSIWRQISRAFFYCQSTPPYRIKRQWETALHITKREYEVINLLSLGLSPLEISRQLGICEKTISTHKRNMMKKLCFTRNTELHQWMMSGGLNVMV